MHQKLQVMKNTLLLAIVLIVGFMFSIDAGAHGWRRYRAPRPYYAPTPIVVSVPVPAPAYRPYCAAPVYRDVWVQPHWRYTPYGREWIPGHYIRQRIY